MTTDKRVVKQDNNIIISFRYDPYTVEVVGRFGGRKFDNKNKVWIVPIAQLKQVLNVLMPLDFEIDPALLEHHEALRKKYFRLERMRNGEFKEGEKQQLSELNLPMFVFQQCGSGFMCVADSALNGDQPGLGKTIQAIAAAKLKKCKKILVFTFATLKDTWADEIAKWAPEMSSIIIKGEKAARNKLWTKDKNFYIANYEQLLKDLPEILKHDWDAIIADEATRISNPKAKTTIYIKKIPAKYRWPLSGTPLSNSVQDVWSIIDFCVPGALGSYYQFVDKYCEKDKWGSIKSYKNLDLLRKEIHPYCIRRLKKEVLQQLPPKLYENIYIDLSASERKMYNAIK